LVVENDEQLDKYLEVRDRLPMLKKVVVLDRKGLTDFEDPDILFLDQLYEVGQRLERSLPHFL